MRPTSKWLFVPGFPSGSPEIVKVRTPVTLGLHNFVCKLQLRWGLKQNCSPCWELFNGMSHATCTQGNWVDSQLLMVKNQTANLTLGPSFGHNLCFICPNGSCKPILDIYILTVFQWYKELFEPLGFDSCNHSLNIWKSIEIPPPKVEAPLGMWKFILSHFPSLSGFPLGPQPCKPLPWSQAQG
jgi:hypothetical protein